MALSDPECLSCVLVTMVNETATEVSLFLDKNQYVKGVSATDKSGKQAIPSVMTPKGCLYNSALFSKDLTYYVLDCKGPDVPKVLLFKTSTNQPMGVLDSNHELKRNIANMTLPKVRIFNVTLSSGYVASVRVFLPPDITIDTFASYPLVVQV